jgi:hypothetical protein
MPFLSLQSASLSLQSASLPTLDAALKGPPDFSNSLELEKCSFVSILATAMIF